MARGVAGRATGPGRDPDTWPALVAVGGRAIAAREQLQNPGEDEDAALLLSALASLSSGQDWDADGAVREGEVTDALGMLASLAERQADLQDQTQQLISMVHTAAYSIAARKAVAHKRRRDGHGRRLPVVKEAGAGAPAPGGLPATLTDLYADTATARVLDECVQRHPGVDACTKGSLRVSQDGSSAELILRTRVTVVNAEHHPVRNPECLAALASQSVVEAGKRILDEQACGFHGTALLPKDLQTHSSLVRTLREGQVVGASRKDPVSPYGHPSYLVDLQDPDSPRVVKAIFKPRVPGDSDGWHRVAVEWVAYELGVALGMDVVPPVAMREGVRLPGIDGEVREGAMMYFAAGCKELREVPEGDWGRRKDVLLSDTRILDVLLQNSDRHHGHFLWGEHWARGHWSRDGQWRGDPGPVLIDHAAGFRKEALVTMTHDNAFMTGAVCVVSPETYLRLRFLDGAVADKFAGVLSDDERAALLERARGILQYLDRLVAERGYGNVVVN